MWKFETDFLRFEEPKPRTGLKMVVFCRRTENPPQSKSNSYSVFLFNIFFDTNQSAHRQSALTHTQNSISPSDSMIFDPHQNSMRLRYGSALATAQP
jgi:hypothetical protein